MFISLTSGVSVPCHGMRPSVLRLRALTSGSRGCKERRRCYSWRQYRRRGIPSSAPAGADVRPAELLLLEICKIWCQWMSAGLHRVPGRPHHCTAFRDASMPDMTTVICTVLCSPCESADAVRVHGAGVPVRRLRPEHAAGGAAGDGASAHAARAWHTELFLRSKWCADAARMVTSGEQRAVGSQRRLTREP